MSIKLFCSALIAFTAFIIAFTFSAFIIAFTAFIIAFTHPCLPPTQVRRDLAALPGQRLLASLWLWLGACGSAFWFLLHPDAPNSGERTDLGPLPAGFSVVLWRQ